MSTIHTLLNRSSHSKLVEPGPNAEGLQDIIGAALRAPDHGRLRPWRFLIVEGDRRRELGEIFARSLSLNGVAESAAIERAKNAPLRAPTILVALLHYQPHPKISRAEQGYAVAAALHAAQLACESAGFGSMWRTGGYATDPEVISALGGEPEDEVIGFLYIGTRHGPSKVLSEESVETYARHF